MCLLYYKAYGSECIILLIASHLETVTLHQPLNRLLHKWYIPGMGWKSKGGTSRKVEARDESTEGRFLSGDAYDLQVDISIRVSLTLKTVMLVGAA